jgi:hypothetical protein
MAISRMQQPRQMYGLGSFVKKITKGVKKIVKSPIGKAAILGIGAFGLPGAAGQSIFSGFAPQVLKTGASNFLFGTGLPTAARGPANKGIFGVAKNFLGGEKTFGKTAAMFGIGALGGAGLQALEAAGVEDPSQVRDVEALKAYMRDGYMKLNPDATPMQVDRFIEGQTYEYRADGGRIGYGDGSDDKSEMAKRIEELMDDGYDFGSAVKKYMEETRDKEAMGGRIGYAFGNKPEQNAIKAAGIEGLPLNQNPAGVTELDLRDSGGFIPPVGVKEKADDIPAMLANNEFVFTADAVRGMGDGNVNKGAQRMYDMMKKLEKGGRV